MCGGVCWCTLVSVGLWLPKSLHAVVFSVCSGAAGSSMLANPAGKSSQQAERAKFWAQFQETWQQVRMGTWGQLVQHLTETV